MQRRELVEAEQTFHDIERSILRKEKPKIEFDEVFHDIYDPDFSSENEQDSFSNHSREHTEIPMPSKSNKSVKKPKKKQIVKTKQSIQAFVKSLRKNI